MRLVSAEFSQEEITIIRGVLQAFPEMTSKKFVREAIITYTNSLIHLATQEMEKKRESLETAKSNTGAQSETNNGEGITSGNSDSQK